MKSAEANVPEASALREVRFSLRRLLLEVAEERRFGAFGAEKMKQADIARAFRRKGRKTHG